MTKEEQKKSDDKWTECFDLLDEAIKKFKLFRDRLPNKKQLEELLDESTGKTDTHSTTQ